MAALFDKSGQSTGGTSTGVTYGFTCSGCDRLLIAFIGYNGEASPRTPSAITYGGVAMTAVPGGSAHDGASNGVIAYYLLNPAAGTNNISITFAATVFQLAVGVISFHSAHQSSPLGIVQTGANAATSAPTVTISSTASNIVTAGTISDSNTSMSITSGTSRVPIQGFGGAASYDIGTIDGGGTLSWSYATTGPGWAIVGVEVKGSDYTDASQGDAIRFYPRPSFPERMKGAIIEGTDGDPVAGTYTTLYTIPSSDQTVYVAYEHQTGLSLGTYRYLRLRAAASCYGNVTEIEFYRAGIKLIGTGYGSPGSFGGGGATFDKALDNNISTFFDAPNPDNQYMGLDMGAAAITLPDSFLRADNLDLGAPYDPGYSNSAKIVSNQVMPQVVSAEGIETWNADVFTNDQFAECTIASLTNTGSIVGVVLRCAAPPTQTMYWIGAGIYTNVTYTFIKKRVSGTETQLIAPTQTWAVGDTLRAEIVGTTITVFRNGAQTQTTTDAAIAGGRIGVYVYNDTANFAKMGYFNGGNLVVSVGQPTVKRFGGIPHMRLTRNQSVW